MKKSIPTRVIVWLFAVLLVPLLLVAACKGIGVGPMAAFGPTAAAILILIVVFLLDRFLATGRGVAHFVAILFFVGIYVSAESQSTRPLSSFPPEASRSYIRGYWNAWKYALGYCVVGIVSVPLSRRLDKKHFGPYHK